VRARFVLVSLAAAAISLAGLIARDAAGALPPEAVKRLQDQAPEALDIETVSVEANRTQRTGRGGFAYVHIRVVAVARIENVIRSAVKFKPGDTIRITYEIGEPIAGPGYPIEIEPGKRYVAYVACQRVVECAPAAISGSFVRRP
jgi:hypothetical protein